jgi:AcrR family transcriptional regulator
MRVPAKDRAGEARHREILETAARLICKAGYEGTSVQEIALACGLTKAGLYHHIPSKERLLYEIMSYGMDLFEEQVLSRVQDIADPLERLKSCMARNVELVTLGASKEVTIILHETDTLTGHPRATINARKKRYVRFLETAFREAMKRGQIREVNPTVAAFGFLGMVLWTYKWFKPSGKLSARQVAEGMVDLLFTGLAAGG